MISKPINEIQTDDLDALIRDEVREGKTIEYKLQLPGGADRDKVRFLAVVSSLANTAGGDLLIGVEAVDGIPRALPGIEIDNLDKEKLRLEQIIANGIEPRLPHLELGLISVGDDRQVLVVRVRRSWLGPHRISKNNQFYGRNSAGNYPLDVGELRNAFTLSETVAERIRNFRADRAALLYGDETPVPLMEGGKMILHLLPLSAFTGAVAIDIERHHNELHKLVPLGASGWNSKVNLDEYLNYTGEPGPSRAYTQLFRTGIVEAVAVLTPYSDERSIASVAYERNILQALPRYLMGLREMEVEPPIYVFLSFVGVKGYQFGIDYWNLGLSGPNTLERDIVTFPEIEMHDYLVDYSQAMRPLFDRVWNAFGYLRSFNYDDDGNWCPR